MLRGTLIWVSTIGGILGLLFLFLDRYEAVSVSPWMIGAFILLSIFAAVVLADHERRAKKRRERGRLEENKTVLRDEIRSNLQSLASQINYTETMEPQMPAIPRRPGETRVRFEDRARDEFARWVDYFSSMYQQFAFTDATYAAQRVNVATFEEKSRLAVERAYAATAEAKKRFLLYVEQLRGLLESTPDDSDRRHRRAQVLTRQTVNALTSHWFEILENWLLLNPTETDLRSVESILPWVLEENLHPARLEAGAIGRRFALEQQARLANEKVKLVVEEMTDRRPASTAAPPTDAVEAVSKAGLAYLEGDPNHAVEYLETALRFGTLTEDQEHYVKASLLFLSDPDLFDGVPGVYLIAVETSAAAAQASLERGDVILRYNSEIVKEPSELSVAIAAARDAPSVAVEFIRRGERSTGYVAGGASLGVTGTTLVYFAPSVL